MSISYSIDHLSTSVEDVSVEVAPKSEFTLQSTSTVNGVTETSYVLSSGDNAYPATVTYRSEIQKRAAALVRRLSMTFSTWAVKADSVTGIELRSPVNLTIAINVPADMTIEVADLDDLIGNAFSFLYASVTAKARSTAWLQKMLYGATQVS